MAYDLGSTIWLTEKIERSVIIRDILKLYKISISASKSSFIITQPYSHCSFFTLMTDLNNCNGDIWLSKPKTFTIWILQEMFFDPWMSRKPTHGRYSNIIC